MIPPPSPGSARRIAAGVIAYQCLRASDRSSRNARAALPATILRFRRLRRDCRGSFLRCPARCPRSRRIQNRTGRTTSTSTADQPSRPPISSTTSMLPGGSRPEVSSPPVRARTRGMITSNKALATVRARPRDCMRTSWISVAQPGALPPSAPRQRCVTCRTPTVNVSRVMMGLRLRRDQCPSLLRTFAPASDRTAGFRPMAGPSRASAARRRQHSCFA